LIKEKSIGELFEIAGTKTGVRFGWWGAEEIGLVGSTFYVDELAKNE